MITAIELKKIAAERLQDAEALLAAGRFEGAVYLGGYVIELALKSRICKTLGWPAFPATRGEFQDYQSFRTHDLNVLLNLSGVKAKIRTNYIDDWSAVATWNPEERYNPVGTKNELTAGDFVRAARKLLEAL